MALHQGTVAGYRDLVRALVIIAAVIVLMLAANVVFGVQHTGPAYDIVPDPAGLALPF